MKEWTSVINEENLKNPKWNIYLYSFSDSNGNGFKVGKADKSVSYRYKNADLNGKTILRLAHQDIVKGKDSDVPIVNHFKNDARFKIAAISDETFYFEDGYSIDDAISKFEKFFEREDTRKYTQSLDEIETRDEILRYFNNNKKQSIIGYFCPRYHKTAMVLNVIDKRQTQLNIILSYAHTIENSYTNDVINYGLSISVKNVDEITKEELQESLDSGEKIALIFFMTGTKNTTNQNRLSVLPNGLDVDVYIDEADIGLSTSISKDKIEALTKTVNVKKLMVLSGTGLSKMEETSKFFGIKNPKIMVRSYVLDVLKNRGDAATSIDFIKFKNTYPLLESIFPDIVFENWNDETIQNNRNSIEMLLKMFFKREDFFLRLETVAQMKNDNSLLQNIGNLKAFVGKHFEKDAATILFVGNKNSVHNYIKDILDSLNVPSFIIDGNTTNGGDAEDFAKGKLEAYPNAVFIATNMANRSFSVSKIKNEIILMNDPAEASYTQKCYRVATADNVFKTGYIWDFTLGKMDENLFGIIGPELKRGNDSNWTLEKTLEEILETGRINFFFEALYNKNVFEKISLDKLSKQLIFTTSYFDISVEELATNSEHDFMSDIGSYNGSSNNTGNGDRNSKTIATSHNSNSEDNENETAQNNAEIFKNYAKMILGCKTYFYDLKVDNLGPDWENLLGISLNDVKYVLNMLIGHFGAEALKSRMTDDWKCISNKNTIEVNTRNVDYDYVFGRYINSWALSSKILVIGMKSPKYIEWLKSKFSDICVIEFSHLKNFDGYMFAVGNTEIEKEKSFINLLKNMKFDHIIMNPPYSGSLHLKILREAMKHSDDIVNLSPNFYRDYKKQDGPLASEIDEIDIFESQSMFGGIKLSFPLCVQHYVKGKEVDWYAKYTPKAYYIFKKLKFDKTFKDVNKINYNGEKYFVPLMLMRMVNVGYVEDTIIHPKFKFIENGLCNGLPWKEARPSASGTNPDRACGGIPFGTKEEAENFIAYTETKFFRCIVKCFHTNTRYILSEYPFMPTYTHLWTDQMLYDYFGLTEDEIKTIENEVE